MRIFAYVRVSSRDQIDNYSIGAQERAIREYCASHGWSEPTIFVDLGRSGYTDVTEKRPEFARMLDEAEAGGCDVIVIHRLDRFARSLMTTLRELKRLQRANVGFVSIGEQMDFATPIGRVFLAMLAALSEYYSDNLSRESKKGLAERKAQGYVHQSLPYGARLANGGKALEVDPATAAHLARVLDVASRRSYDVAARDLNAAGVPPHRAAVWSGGTVQAVVRAAGWLLDQPPPWPERYRAAAERPRAAPVRRDSHVWMLTGLMRCGTCGGRIVHAGTNTARRRAILCFRAGRGRGCLPGAPRKTNAAVYERAILDWAAHLPNDWEVQRAAVRLAARDDPALEALGAIRQQRLRVKAQHDAGLIGDEEMLAEAALLAERERAIAPRTPDVFRYASALTFLRKELPALPAEAQNSALRAALNFVKITGTSVEVVPTNDVAELLREAGRVVAVA